MRTPRLGVALLLASTILAASACRTEPAPEAPPAADAPADTPLSTEEVADLQASLANYLEPGTFRAELRGSPFDEETEEALVERSLEGSAAASDTVADESSRHGLRIQLQSPAGPTQILLSVLQAAPVQGDSSPAVQADTYEQQPNEQMPLVAAEMVQGNYRFASRAGTLVIETVREDGVAGRFFFEMRQPGMTERDQWFSLVGVFDTGVASER